MKVKKMLVIGIIISIVIILIPTISKAGVESKPGGTVWTNITISDAYTACYNMRDYTSTLGNNTLDPHLTLNKDWAAVSYLALSSYGAVTANQPPDSIPQVNSTTYTSTTGNPTGVMDFGKKHTFTSAGNEQGLKNAGNKGYRKKLIDNLGTKYVETLPTTYNTETTKGMALTETNSWFSTGRAASSDYPLSIRGRYFIFLY